MVTGSSNVSLATDCSLQPNSSYYGIQSCAGQYSPTSFPSSSPTLQPNASKRKKHCFAGSETLITLDGRTKMIQDIVLGDKILVMSMDKKSFMYSPVVAIPHDRNNDDGLLIVITTESNKDIKITPDHLIVGGKCEKKLKLVYADFIRVNDCVQTIDGIEIVKSIEKIYRKGLYTVVPLENSYIVVNGILASPFAINHELANNYYNLYRFLYKIFPKLISHHIISKATEIFSSMIPHGINLDRCTISL